MDPKMDSGCVKPGDEFEELYDVSKSLLPEEVLGIIDQLLCHEVRPCFWDPLGIVLTEEDVVASWVPPLSDSLHQCVRRGAHDAGPNAH